MHYRFNIPWKVSGSLTNEYSSGDFMEIGFAGPVEFSAFYWPIIEGEEFEDNVWRLHLAEDFEGFPSTEVEFFLGQVEFMGSGTHKPALNFEAICNPPTGRRVPLSCEEEKFS